MPQFSQTWKPLSINLYIAWGSRGIPATQSSVSRDYYRAKQEEQRWTSERDPIAILGAHLIEQHESDRATLDRIAAELTTQMDAAMQWAIDAPYPSPEEVTEDVYA